MKLKRIYFDSFKSLINEQLEISDNCIGIVGINESGKSNILQAIKILDPLNSLSVKDSPKTNKSNPKIRYIFESTPQLKEVIIDQINSWFDDNTLTETRLKDFDFKIEYLIEYDIENQMETRNFNLISTNLKDYKFQILLPEFLSSENKFLLNRDYIPLNKAILISHEHINQSLIEQKDLKAEILKLNEDIRTLNKQAQELQKKIKQGDKNETLEKRLRDYESELSIRYERQKELNEIEQGFNPQKSIDDLEKNIRVIEDENENLIDSNSTYKTSINTLKIQKALSPPQKANLTKFTNSFEQNYLKIEANNKELQKLQLNLKNLKTPLNEKYSNNSEILENYLTNLLEETLRSNLPEVIFWQHSPEYILEPNTTFTEILSKKSFAELPRPLINVFRIGLNIQNFQELSKTISIIQTDEDDRSKLMDKLNDNLNNHIRNIWGDYDQNIRVNLEENQIRIQFYDPNFKERSYFKMSEKSQGAQTFISFLFTIGAEAAKGVLKNKILLLDEPEIHLHPSGVRYMLKELIKISKKHNLVMYATHSIFMIDRENYDRHVYLKKNEERTSINPSQKNRIGFFMQEEVLHEALNIDLSKDFSSTNLYNFVFEGDGDVYLFKYIYENLLKKTPLIKKNCSFYQGGKCSDIRKYLIKNPVQLGTKWIFVLDKDNAANNLKDFIIGKYKDYLDKDLFIYQYSSEKGEIDIEFEDLLSEDILKSTYLSTFQELNYNIDNSHFTDINWSDTKYIEYNEDLLNFLSLNKSEREVFKMTFKQKLNKQIELIIQETKKEDIEKIFKIYIDWFNKIIVSLNDSLKK